MTKPKRNGRQYVWIDTIGLLVRQPRTVEELAQLTGQNESTIYHYVRALAAEGLIAREGVKHKPDTNTGATVWKWQ